MGARVGAAVKYGIFPLRYTIFTEKDPGTNQMSKRERGGKKVAVRMR